MVTCLLCQQPTKLVLDLGMSPLANELRNNRFDALDKFPLRLVQCIECHHLQLDHHVAPERLYGPGYAYTTANAEHMKAYAEEMARRFRPKSVVDIGGNDGLFCSSFSDTTLTLNVDPAATTIHAPTMVEMFNESLAHRLLDEQGQVDLITCNNCFAHNADLSPILKGIKALLAPKGTFVLEVAYALPMLRQGLFDLLYHEHIHHWTMHALSGYLANHGLNVFEVQDIPTHGGSLRVFARHGGNGNKKPLELLERIKREREALPGLVEDFPKLVEAERKAYKAWARSNTTMSVGLLGYPAKACTLLTWYGAGSDPRWTFDDNPKKIGKVDPWGRTIQSASEIPKGQDAPAWLLVCSWNYAEEMMRRAREAGYRGAFLLPHPVRAVS